MKSIFAKLVLWLGVTLALCSAGFLSLSLSAARTSKRAAILNQMLLMQCEEARLSYEHGGPNALRGYLTRVEHFLPGRHYFVDASGHDLLTGENRSGMIADASPWPGSPPLFGQFLTAVPSQDRKYRLIVAGQPNTELQAMIPYYLLMLCAVATLCYFFAAHFVSPVQALRRTVDRFGRGDLSARTGSTRSDELGDVAKAFDQMARRIERLVTAERRLLHELSSEVRGPIASLEAAIASARNSENPKAALPLVQQEAERLHTLVDQLLQVTLEGDTEGHSVEDLSLRHLLRCIVDDCSLEAETRGIRLSLRADEPLVMKANRELLARAIENVLRNAIRHSPERSAIEIVLENIADMAQLSVRDYGADVPEWQLEEIFKPFLRLDAGRAFDRGAMETGLAVALRVIRLHHGELSAFNMRPGLCVRMELPVEALS